MVLEDLLSFYLMQTLIVTFEVKKEKVHDFDLPPWLIQREVLWYFMAILRTQESAIDCTAALYWTKCW